MGAFLMQFDCVRCGGKSCSTTQLRNGHDVPVCFSHRFCAEPVDAGLSEKKYKLLERLARNLFLLAPDKMGCALAIAYNRPEIWG